MPIYEYRCASCGFEKDYLQKVSDPRLTECPECGKATFEKQVTAAGFQLKGSGWYATDFKHSGAKPAPDKNKPAAESEQAAGDTAAGDKDKPTGDKDKPTGDKDKATASKEPAANKDKPAADTKSEAKSESA